MKFSLLCPTRERISGISDLLTSIKKMTHNLADIEILFAVDDDDIATHQFFNTIQHQVLYPDMNISFYSRERTEFLNGDYYNWLAAKSKGEFIWAVADDVVLLVEHWDKTVYELAQSYLADKKDRIVCVGLRDSTPKPKPSLPNFPCFPMVSREAYNFFGFLLHPNIPTWGADVCLYELYVGAKRYLEIYNYVYLDHVSWHTRQKAEDKVAKRIKAIFAKRQHDPDFNVDCVRTNIVPPQIATLKQYLGKVARENG